MTCNFKPGDYVIEKSGGYKNSSVKSVQIVSIDGDKVCYTVAYKDDKPPYSGETNVSTVNYMMRKMTKLDLIL